MKRIFRKSGLMICLWLMAGMFSGLSLCAQLNLRGVHANFGVDADTRSGFSKYATGSPVNFTDDWFGTMMGHGVLDTTNAAYYKTLLQANKNISFLKNMSKPAYSIVNNRMWLDAIYIHDYTSANGKDSTAFGTAAKNAENPVTWDGTTTSIPVKTDIVDAYAHLRRDGPTIFDSLWLFAGVSTIGTNGDRYFDIELYTKKVTYFKSSGLFTSLGLNNGHTEWIFDPFGNIIQTGDLIISVSYPSGLPPVVDIRIWVSRLTYQTINPDDFDFGNSFEGGLLYGYASIKTNGGTLFGSGGANYSNNASKDTSWSTPWGTLNTSGNWSAHYNRLQFLEIGLNLSKLGIDPALYSTLGPCERIFHSVFFKSRSSSSFSANLQDFAGPISFSDLELGLISDAKANKDTITCDKPTVMLKVKNPRPSHVYSWMTLDGEILSNPDSVEVEVGKSGLYTLLSSIAVGCPLTIADLVSVPADKFPPVATADITLTPDGQVQLLGGDPVLSDVLTPFGKSKGLDWQWQGPNGFQAQEQNPIIQGPWAWGSYYLTLREKRNGCLANTSLEISFRPGTTEPVNSSKPEMLVQKREVRISAGRLYLDLTEQHQSVMFASVYTIDGKLLMKQRVQVSKGKNAIGLPLSPSGQARIVVLHNSDNRPVFTRKVLF